MLPCVHMDISKLKPVRIFPNAREKVIYDFFPDLACTDDITENLDSLNDKTAPLHAGALCLYATTLITGIHEKDPLFLEPYYKERELSYKTLIKENPKYASFTDEQISTFAQNLIIKDIRNSFAHGNFEISFDIYTRKLNFVLKPQRKDFITPEPIVISKNALINANKKILHEIGRRYSFYSEPTLHYQLDNHFSKVLKSFMLPMQMLNLSKYYLDKSVIKKTDIMFESNMYHLIQYALLASKITYDQNEYYSLFGKKSSIFDTISFIRNSLAHDNIEFLDQSQTVNYTDKDRTLSESVAKSASKLLIVDMQKQTLLKLKDKHKPESIETLASKFQDIFNFFFDNTFDFEDIINAVTEDYEDDDSPEKDKE